MSEISEEMIIIPESDLQYFTSYDTRKSCSVDRTWENLEHSVQKETGMILIQFFLIWTF